MQAQYVPKDRSLEIAAVDCFSPQAKLSICSKSDHLKIVGINSQIGEHSHS